MGGMLRRAAFAVGAGVFVFAAKKLLNSSPSAMAAAETTVATLRSRVPTIFSPAGEAVPLETALPPGQVTVLHLLRRFK